MKRLSVMVGTLAVLGAAVLPGSAGAVTTPNGGAANMVNSHTWPGGMSTAMSVDNANGNQGMWCAVDITALGYPTPPSPGSCPEG